MSSSFLPKILHWNASYIDGNPLKDYVIDVPTVFDNAKIWSNAFTFHLLEEIRSNIMKSMTDMDFSLSSEVNLKSNGRFDGEVHKIGAICNLNRSGNFHSCLGLIVKNGVSFFNTSFPINSENFIVKLVAPKDSPSDFYEGSDIHVEFSFGSGHLQDLFLENGGTGFSLCLFTVITLPFERVWDAMNNISSINSCIALEILNYGILKDDMSALPSNQTTNEEVNMSSLNSASRDLLSGRNHSQQAAIMKVHSAGLCGNPRIQIIHGPPG